MTWTCPNCGAIFVVQQAMKDHATTTCRSDTSRDADISSADPANSVQHGPESAPS